MLTRLVVSIVRTCTRFATPVVIFSLILAVGAGYYTARNFSINTDINTLISPDLDWRKRDNQFEEAFDREKLILAVVEARTPELTGAAAKALAEKLAGDTSHFESVTPLGSGEFFEKNGLLFLPTEEVAQVTGELQSAAPLIEIMAGDPSIRGLTGALETGLAGIKRGQAKLENAARPFNLIAQTVEDVLNKGKATFSWRELASDKPLTDSDRRAFIEFKPILDYQALEPGKDATDAIRQAAADLNFPSEYGARVRLTGPVPIANEEYATVQDGAIVNGIGTVVIVLIILWLALHSAKIIFAVFINLFIGLSITTAVGLMMVGSLNLLSIAFAVLFVGLGVDFGIQYSVRYRSERFKNDNLTLALENAARRSAVPLSLAAMATAAGFLCFLPTDYKGISELGKIAGAGMLVAFITSITVLPALLDLLNPPGEKEPVGYAFLAPVDHFLEKHRVIIIVGTLLVVLAGLPLLYFMKFDFNPINLRNPRAELIATFLDLRNDPNTGANAINVMTNSEADAKKIEERLAKLPEVLEVRSLDNFVPQDQPAKLKLIAQAAKILNPALNPDSVDAAPSDQENVEALKSAAESLRKTAGDNKGPGAVASRRLADALSRLAEFERGDARQGAERFRCAAQDRDRSAQQHAAGPAGYPEDAAAGDGQWLEDQGRTDARRGVAEGRPQRQRYAAQIRKRRARGRAQRDRRTGLDPQVRRYRGEGVRPRRHMGAGRDQPVALADAASDQRRADDAGAALGSRRGDAGDLRADRAAAQLRKYCRVPADARRRRRVQDLLRDGVAVGPDRSAADQSDAGDLFQRADDGDRFRKPVAIVSSGHREHGQAARAFAGNHARRGVVVPACPNGQTPRYPGGGKCHRRRLTSRRPASDRAIPSEQGRGLPPRSSSAPAD